MEIIMDKEPITVNGLQNLKAELDDLKNNQRPKVVDAIAERLIVVPLDISGNDDE